MCNNQWLPQWSWPGDSHIQDTVYGENEQQGSIPWLQETDPGLFREPAGRTPWEAALQGKGAQEIWQQVFKDNLLQSYKQLLLMLSKTSRSIRRLAWLNRELRTALQCKRTKIQEVKSGRDYKEGIWRTRSILPKHDSELMAQQMGDHCSHSRAWRAESGLFSTWRPVTHGALLPFTPGDVLVTSLTVTRSQVCRGHQTWDSHYPHGQRALDRLGGLGNTNPPILKKRKCKPAFGNEQPLEATQAGKWPAGEQLCGKAPGHRTLNTSKTFFTVRTRRVHPWATRPALRLPWGRSGMDWGLRHSAPISPWLCWGGSAGKPRTGPVLSLPHNGAPAPGSEPQPRAGENRSDQHRPHRGPGPPPLRSAPPAATACPAPRPAPPRTCPAVPRKAALTQAQRARGAGGTMASGKERLDRAQVSRGAGRELPERCRGLRGLNQALPERGQAGFDLRLCRCGAVAGEEGGGGSRGFYQKEKQGRRAAPQRGRERPSPGDGVEGPAGGKSHQNVRHRYAAAWLLGLLVSLGLEKSTWPVLSLRGLAAAALSWERPCRARRQLYPPLGTARSWAVPALCTEHTDSVGCQLQGMCLSVLQLEKIDHLLCLDPPPPNH